MCESPNRVIEGSFIPHFSWGTFFALTPYDGKKVKCGQNTDICKKSTFWTTFVNLGTHSVEKKFFRH